MSTIYVETDPHSAEVMSLVREAIESEARRLELALEAARRRLAPFEQKYGVTSEHFISEMASEDLEGADDEYVRWAGEYRLMERLQQKVTRIRGIRFGA